MQVGKIVSFLGKTLSFKGSDSKQDLVSFGVQNADKNELMSKETADAIKNKANISFDGHHKTVTVTEEGEMVYTGTKYKYGSNGNPWYTLDYDAGYDYNGVPYIGKEDQKKWVRSRYSAKLVGSRKIGTDKKSPEKALENAIKKSEYFTEGSTIHKIRESYRCDKETTSDVYFAEMYEYVDRSILNDRTVNYIVLAPGAEMAAEQPEPKKSLFERIFK